MIARRTLKLALFVTNIAVFVAALAWCYANLSLAAFISSVSAVSTSSMLFLLCLSVLLMIAYGLRLRCLLDNRWRDAQAIVMLGFGLNSILPLRLGEVAKITYARRFFGTRPEQLLVATGVEKCSDLGALTLIGLAALNSPVFAAIRPGLNMIALVLALCLAGVGLVLLLAKNGLAAGWMRRFSWLTRLIDSIREQVRPRTLWRVVLWTGLIWVLTLWSIHEFFGAALSDFGMTDAIVLCLLITLAIALPGTPAGLGVVEAAIVTYLVGTAHADPNQALALAILYRLASLILQLPAALAIVAWNLEIVRSLRQRKAGDWRH